MQIVLQNQLKIVQLENPPYRIPKMVWNVLKTSAQECAIRDYVISRNWEMEMKRGMLMM